MSRSLFTTLSWFGSLRRGGRCALFVVLTSFTLASSQALAQQIKTRPLPTQEQKIEQWKQQLNEQGIGEKSRWEARLADGRKIKGYLHEIHEDGFTLINRKTEENFRIAFSDVKRLQRQTPRWQLVAGIGGAVFAGLAVAGAVAASRR